jgi:hypothetical protein
MTWFYKDGDQEIGPISKADIQNLIHAKRIAGAVFRYLSDPAKILTWLARFK